MLMLSKAISFHESPTLHGPHPILSSLSKLVPVVLPLKSACYYFFPISEFSYQLIRFLLYGKL